MGLHDLTKKVEAVVGVLRPTTLILPLVEQHGPSL